MHYYANIVISHLLDEGYAPNFESAEQIFGSMSDEWIEDILESDAAAAVAARAKTLSRQRKGQTSERKAIYKNLATQAGERANPSPSGRDLNNRTGMTADFRRSRRGQSDWNIEHDKPGGITRNPKKLRKQKALGEFGESYEIDEGLGGARNASDEKRAQARLDDINARSDAGLAAYRAGTSRWQKQRKADQAQQFLRSHPRRKSSAKNEEYDVYDVILSYLLDEGYAETPEAAEAIMVNMNQEYEELDEGIRSAISRLFGKKPAAPQSRGEQLRAKHGSDIRGKRYERTQQLHGRNSSQAQQVSQAGASLRDIKSRDTSSTHEWRGGGNAAQRRAGRTPQPQTIGSNERASQFKGKAGQKPMNIRPSGPVFVRRDIQDMPLASQRAARGKKKPLATGSRLGEGYIYDMILEYLLDEGYAETQKAAEAIMVNMGEDWMESIMIDEGMTMKDFMKNRKKSQKKEEKTDAERRGHVDRTWADTGTYSTDQARRRRTAMSDSTRQARHRVAVAPDADDEHFSADRTRNPKKLRKQRAMGEIR